MDLLSQTQIALRDAAYSTHELAAGALSFEDDTLLGFAYVFPTVQSLLSNWNASQKAALARCAPQLRMSREKAWNVYAVFLTEGAAKAPEQQHLDAIEEDFAATRKIARAGVANQSDLRQALLPLLPIRPGREAGLSDYESKLRSRLGMLPPAVVEAIVGTSKPADIARILMERSS